MTALKKSLVSEILISLEGLNNIIKGLNNNSYIHNFWHYSKFERTTYNSIYFNNECNFI